MDGVSCRHVEDECFKFFFLKIKDFLLNNGI